MKNVGSRQPNGGADTKAFFHRPSGLKQDFEALLFLGAKPRKSLGVPVKWVMKNTSPAAALAWRPASERFITLLEVFRDHGKLGNGMTPRSTRL
jgi:hypothetical protein